jgi:hypothetical protein
MCVYTDNAFLPACILDRSLALDIHKLPVLLRTAEYRYLLGTEDLSTTSVTPPPPQSWDEKWVVLL